MIQFQYQSVGERRLHTVCTKQVRIIALAYSATRSSRGSCKAAASKNACVVSRHNGVRTGIEFFARETAHYHCEHAERFFDTNRTRPLLAQKQPQRSLPLGHEGFTNLVAGRGWYHMTRAPLDVDGAAHSRYTDQLSTEHAMREKFESFSSRALTSATLVAGCLGLI